MRAAFSILGLVIVLAIVLLSAKKQMQAIAPVQTSTAAGASADSSPDAAKPALPVPSQVGAQVQGLVQQAEQRSSEAMP